MFGTGLIILFCFISSCSAPNPPVGWNKDNDCFLYREGCPEVEA